MRYVLSFNDALQDSPKFRRELAFAENNIQSFEHKFEKLINYNRSFQESAKHFLHSFESLVNQFSELADYYAKEKDEPVKQTLDETVQYLKHVKTLNENLFDCVNRSVFKHGTYYVTNEIKPLHDNKKSFDKLSDDLDLALVRNSQIGRSKVSETEENAKIIKALRSYFAHAVLDYVFHVNKFAQSKRLTTLNLVLSLIRGHKSYFESGSSLASTNDEQSAGTKIPNGFASFDKKSAVDLDKIENLASESHKDLVELTKHMEERHSLVKERESSLNSLKSLQDRITVSRASKECYNGNKVDLYAVTSMEGYLFKRSTGKFKTWNRRWFAIRNNQLVYCKRQGPIANTLPNAPTKRSDVSSGSESPGSVLRSDQLREERLHCEKNHFDMSELTSYKVMEKDLRLCSVKVVSEIDRRFCFEVISPLRSHLLQADSEVLRQAWINAVQAGISSAYNDNSYDLPRVEMSLNDETCTLSVSNKIFLNQSNSTKSNKSKGKKPEPYYHPQLARLDGGASLLIVSTLESREGKTDTVANCANIRPDPAPKTVNDRLINNVTEQMSEALYGRNLNLLNQSTTKESSANVDGGDDNLSVRDILGVAGNSLCCDCQAHDPEWASINLGITLCIECSGIHRSLGVHRSKVRSLYLDAWEPEHIKIMLALGNDSVNDIYLGKLAQDAPRSGSPQTATKIDADSTREQREAFIKAKYPEKLWVRNIDEPAVVPTLSSLDHVIPSTRSPDQPHGTVRRRISYFETSTSPPDHRPVSSSLCAEKGGTFEVTSSITSSPTSCVKATTPKSFINQLWSPKPAPDQRSNFNEEVGARDKDNEHRITTLLMITGLRGSLKYLAWAFALGQNPNDALILSDPSDYQIVTSALHPPDPNKPEHQIFESYLEAGTHLHVFSGMTPLQIAAYYGNSTEVEYLLLNGAKIDAKNAINGFTALHYATLNGLTRVVCQLIKRGADISLLTDDGREALDLAISQENADIVTLLRVGKLRLGAENFASDDMTFTEVMNDFSKIAPPG